MDKQSIDFTVSDLRDYAEKLEALAYYAEESGYKLDAEEYEGLREVLKHLDKVPFGDERIDHIY